MWPKILYDVSEYTALRERRMLLPERQARKALASLRKDLGKRDSPKTTSPPWPERWKPMKAAIFDRAKALLTNVYPVNAQTYLVKSQRGEGVYRVTCSYH